MKKNHSGRFRIRIPDRTWYKENIGCENACPVNTRASRYISAISHGDYDRAFQSFYVLHFVVFPFLTAVLMAIHFWRVRKDGGISDPL